MSLGLRAFDVVGLGDASVDTLAVVATQPLPGTRQEVLQQLVSGGGQVANALCAMARLGLRVKLLAKVGDDALGVECLASLRETGVDVSDVLCVPGPTRASLGFVSQQDGRRSWCTRPAAHLAMSQHDRFDVALTQGNVMYLSMQQNWLATHVRDVDVPVVVDAEWAPGMSLDLLAVCTVLLADSRFARHVTHHGTPQEWLDGLRDRAPRATWIAVSLGAQGCVAWSKGRTVTVPTLAVDVQDGTGAGDAWHGAFVYAWSRGWPLEAVARFSNVAAALACRRLGARTALPHLAEVQALLALV